MKKIGMLGGMSWQSTMTYYKLINEEINKKLGSMHSAKIIMSSVDFDEIEKLQHQSKWDELASILSKEAVNLENAKADFIIICTNTMHKVLPQLQEHTKLPILHIADATAEQLVKDEIKKVILLGTKFTMQEDFYKNTIIDNYGIEVITPNDEEQEIIHKIIYEELCFGLVKENSKLKYLNIIKRLENKYKTTGVILGCTEIEMLIKKEDLTLNVYDTTKIHALKAVEYALSCK